MTQVPEGAQLSEDGHYWWDAEKALWQPTEGSGGAGATPGATPDAGTDEPTSEEIAAITSADQITERVKPHFQPDGDSVPDDSSQAEVGDLLSDEPAPDAGGQV